MIEHVTYLYKFNLGVAGRLVADLTAEQMVLQPSGAVNHAAWTLGHLVMSANGLARLLSLPSDVPDGWDRVFATGGIPSGDAADYPAKEALLEALAAQHERNTAAVLAADPAWLAEPAPGRAPAALLSDGGRHRHLPDDLARGVAPGPGVGLAPRRGHRSARAPVARVSRRCASGCGPRCRAGPRCG